MTRRERKAVRADRLREWAANRQTAADATLRAASDRCHGDVAFNTQPGHIPERARLIVREDRAFESLRKAKRMESRADGIDTQLDRTIFSDDATAVADLRARIAEREAEGARMKAVNAAWRRAKCKSREDTARWLAATPVVPAEDKARIARTIGLGWRENPPPHEAYELSNLRGRITADKARIAEIERRSRRTEEAESAGGTLVKLHGADYASVTFAEKPDRTALDELKAAGFSWGSGSWVGQRDALPARYRELLPKEEMR